MSSPVVTSDGLGATRSDRMSEKLHDPPDEGP